MSVLVTPSFLYSLNYSSGRQISASNRIPHQVTCERMQKEEATQAQQQRSNQQYRQKSFPPSNDNSFPEPEFSEPSRLGNNEESFKIMTCPSCNLKVPEKDFDEHQKINCKGQQIPCEFCSLSIPISFFAMHEEQCSKNPQNIGTSAENIQIPCEICGKTFAGNIYEKHVEDCSREPSRPQGQNQSQSSNFTYLISSKSSTSTGGDS